MTKGIAWINLTVIAHDNEKIDYYRGTRTSSRRDSLSYALLIKDYGETEIVKLLEKISEKLDDLIEINRGKKND